VRAVENGHLHRELRDDARDGVEVESRHVRLAPAAHHPVVRDVFT
jgi:hypothetical protein